MNEIKSVEEIIRNNSFYAAMGAAIFLALITIISVLIKEKGEALKIILFMLIALPTLLVTFYLASSTVYLNTISESKGPVHHHADFEIWDCDTKLNLIDPVGLSNKVGTSTFHEHNDNRIHLEGVIVRREEITLGRFFQVVGGKLDSSNLEVPLNQKRVIRNNGDLCEDDSLGEVQVFVYKTNEEAKTFSQEKLISPANYVLSPFSGVPPGDCIIVEFSPVKEKTDKLCEFYKVKVIKGELHGN